ncbi:hypothetical protein Patl1_08509 [Pistacia atlantica]|uniref:Uncharacterized protein n=1 Tax=Pistacia atlantica TaxID=434234 RepID=A0ACC1AG22_9ROSI|nr:hypothetical protein Patl1_08509 [Pistacia atlantica]
MAEMTKYSMEHELGCGLMGGIFQRRSFWPGKKSIRRSTSADSSLVDSANVAKPSEKPDKKHSRRPSSVPPRSSTSQQRSHSRRPSDAARSSTSSSSSSGKPKATQVQDSTDKRKLSKDPPCTSTELSTVVVSNYQKSGVNKALARATSSNIMLIGQLGNLKQLRTGSVLGNNSPNATIKTVDYLYRNLQEGTSKSKHRSGQSRLGGNGVMGNIVRQQPSGEFPKVKGLTNELDPEVLKSMGNDAYKKGRFEDALSLYDGAIALNSNNATYRSNKSAALIAQHRLATIYLRLGEAEKALHHYKQSGSLVDREDIAKAEALQKQLNRCNGARNLKEWSDLLKGTQFAISVGADSAPKVSFIYAKLICLNVISSLGLQRHQEAYATYNKGPKFLIESCTKLFGPAGSAYILVMKAQVYMATGRLEDAVKVAQHAAQLDPKNQEIVTVVKRAKAIASARLSGNLLFKASKYLEACNMYSEGLENEPYNSILLCNRAACRSKLGQYERAVEDCTTALILQPTYSKARLRRADCNAKLERWEASVQDYEMLIREIPGDEEVGRALFEAQVQLKKQRGEDVKDMKFWFKSGMAVVLFCNKANHKQVLQLMEQVCKRFPSVNFLKVEVEDHPYLAKSEGVSSIPAFKIYKNGSRVKEIPGNNRELLEKSVKLYSS